MFESVMMILIIIILMALLFSWVTFGVLAPLFTRETVTLTIRDKGISTSVHSNGNGNASTSVNYLIFTDGETLTDNNCLILGKWGSSESYGNIQTGHTYIFTVYGWRIPVISRYRNIISYEEVKGKG